MVSCGYLSMAELMSGWGIRQAVVYFAKEISALQSMRD